MNFDFLVLKKGNVIISGSRETVINFVEEVKNLLVNTKTEFPKEFDYLICKADSYLMYAEKDLDNQFTLVDFTSGFEKKNIERDEYEALKNSTQFFQEHDLFLCGDDDVLEQYAISVRKMQMELGVDLANIHGDLLFQMEGYYGLILLQNSVN